MLRQEKPRDAVLEVIPSGSGTAELPPVMRPGVIHSVCDLVAEPHDVLIVHPAPVADDAVAISWP
jgi:hypothetical protein